MTLYNLLQIVIVAGVVAFSVLQMFRKLMPKTAHAFQVKSAQVLGRDIQPVRAPATGCGSGCDTCKACGSIANLMPKKDA